jgi:3-hydroxyacyl-CoA dehydrogenase/enoyl-CoA hydratase/3-hydroxybutyryl-CoA epimerase
MSDWRLERAPSGVFRLTFDKAGASSNVLSRAALLELDSLLDEVSADASVKGLIFASAKKSGFIFGADINEFDDVTSAEEGTRIAADGQRIIGRIEQLKVPTVAAINGFALGGGLELALACTYRVAVESYDRCLGLPEVQLGIQPAFGGTVRTVRLLGARTALDLFLTGRLLSPVEARKAGLLDALASSHDDLISAAEQLLARRPPRRHPRVVERVMNLPFVRPFIAKQVRQRMARRARPEHYPAPYAMLDLWVRHGGKGAAALRAETESIGRLFLTQTSRNLVRVFKLRERLKNLAPKSADVRRVHVIGAGVMGGDIAAWCALRGLDVTLQDQATAAIDAAQRRATELFDSRLKAPGAADAAARRLHGDPEGKGRSDADVVIEAIVERLDVKQTVFRETEALARADAMLTSNTSSLRIEDMASALQQPSRLLGLHFFNPVAKLPLVEVIAGRETDPDTLRRAMSFVTQIDKLPLPCRSAPGFVVNRVLTPYMLEALRAHLDGHSIDEIDAAAVAFGMPVGPIELADQVGLDVALHVARILSDTLKADTPTVLEEMVAAGKLGLKSGEGFYRYEHGRPQRNRWSAPADPGLQDRLILPLVNESVACLAEGIIDDPDLVDAGVIFGTGFAPFRGGPVRYARQRGVEDVLRSLRALEARFGSRFAPNRGWDALKP